MSVSSQRGLAALGALVLIVLAYHALAGSHAQARAATTPHSDMPAFLRFDGQGGASVRPDRATIHFTTTGHGTSLVDATNEASKAMRRVMAAMAGGRVARINMATDGVSGFKGDPSDGGYVAEQDLTVTVMKVATTGKLIAAGISAGARATYGPGFSLSERQSVQARAIASAMNEARRKAEAAAAAAGLHVTGVVSVSESAPAYFGSGVLYGASVAKSPEALDIPIRKGAQRVQADVVVVFSYGPGTAG
jgi:uncharacterized protein YggE